MAVIAPTPIDEGPAVPRSADSDTTFDAAYEGFNTWEKTKLQPQANALATNVFNNATEAANAAATATTQADLAMGYRNAANSAAGTATTAAGTATTKAAEAEASAVQASKLILGPKSSAPTVDNQGAVLLQGATYFDTTPLLGKWRAWSGSAWVDPVSVTAGVTSLNGASGALTRTTLSSYGITDGVGTAGDQTIAGNKSFTSNVLLTGTGAIGYGVGSGGTVTQPTSKTTAVTLNKSSGVITMNAEAMSSNSPVTFLLNNSLIGTNDGLHLDFNPDSLATYVYLAYAVCKSQQAYITVMQFSGTSQASAVQLRFRIIKGAST